MTDFIEQIAKGEKETAFFIRYYEGLPLPTIKKFLGSICATSIVGRELDGLTAEQCSRLWKVGREIEEALCPDYNLFSLPNKDNPNKDKKKAVNLPTELDTEQARKYFARAVDAGLMSEQYKWLASKALLACFCQKMSLKLGLGKGDYYDMANDDMAERVCWKPFEELFGAKNLRLNLNYIRQIGNPRGIEKINAIFED